MRRLKGACPTTAFALTGGRFPVNANCPGESGECLFMADTRLMRRSMGSSPAISSRTTTVDPKWTFERTHATASGATVQRVSRRPANYLNRRLSRESWPIEVQPISFIPRSISARIRPSARSTPAWPAAARGKR